jgi:hypothetical protein
VLSFVISFSLVCHEFRRPSIINISFFILFLHLYAIREAKRRERLRLQATAPPGQQNLRQRVQLKKARAREQQAGNTKHEQALKEINRRRTESTGTQRKAGPGVAGASKGASAGVRTQNKHLQHFEKAKQEFKRKQGMMSL